MEGVATATAFAFALVFLLGNVHIRDINAFSIVIRNRDVVVVLVRIIREVALGITGSREV